MREEEKKEVRDRPRVVRFSRSNKTPFTTHSTPNKHHAVRFLSASFSVLSSKHDILVDILSRNIDILVSLHVTNLGRNSGRVISGSHAVTAGLLLVRLRLVARRIFRIADETSDTSNTLRVNASPREHLEMDPPEHSMTEITTGLCVTVYCTARSTSDGERRSTRAHTRTRPHTPLAPHDLMGENKLIVRKSMRSSVCRVWVE